MLSPWGVLSQQQHLLIVSFHLLSCRPISCSISLISPCLNWTSKSVIEQAVHHSKEIFIYSSMTAMYQSWYWSALFIWNHFCNLLERTSFAAWSIRFSFCCCRNGFLISAFGWTSLLPKHQIEPLVYCPSKPSQTSTYSTIWAKMSYNLNLFEHPSVILHFSYSLFHPMSNYDVKPADWVRSHVVSCSADDSNIVVDIPGPFLVLNHNVRLHIIAATGLN